MDLFAFVNTNGVVILFQLFVVLVAAKLLAEIFARLKQPTVVGEILAGVLIGPSVLGWVAPSEALTLFAPPFIRILFSGGDTANLAKADANPRQLI